MEKDADSMGIGSSYNLKMINYNPVVLNYNFKVITFY